MSYDEEKYRFRTALSKLESCDRIIELLLEKDSVLKASGMVLDRYELQAAYSLVARCGIILERFFGELEDREKLLQQFVFDGDGYVTEKALEDGNKHFERILTEKCQIEDEAYEAEKKLAAERVKRGIAWLNQCPELGTWEPCINRNLRMNNPCRCVGGNVFGEEGDTPAGPNGYMRLCALLESDGLSPVELGFQSDKQVCSSTLGEEWNRQVNG